MPTTRYSALPNPRFAPDAEREMEDAFDLNDEHHDDNDSPPLNQDIDVTPQAQSSTSRHQDHLPTYDFEREYDFPPPGSPPPPTAQAIPNDYGNSNGLLPSSPVDRPQPRLPLFRRMLGAVLPSQYQPVATGLRRTGGGTDGVFANMAAKPQPARTVRTEDGQVIVIPEESQKDTPPSYQEAQADAVPPYWETTIHAPGLLSDAGLYIEDLPTGSFFVFCMTTFISFFFQFIGFLVTYLLHTTHAAKYGSRAGLGLTLIQYGLSARIAATVPAPDGSGVQGSWQPNITGDIQDEPNVPVQPISSKDWLSIFFMTFGWFLLLTSILGFWRVKRYELTVQQSNTSSEEGERDRRMQFNFEIIGAPREQSVPQEPPRRDDNLMRDLRSAGLV